MSVVKDTVKHHSHAITNTANGRKVYGNLTRLPLCTNVSRNPHLLRLAEDALQSISLTGPTVSLECDMGHPVGYSDQIVTSENEGVFYARQTKAAGFTRFVKNRPTTRTQYITIQLTRDEEGDYEINNIWIGRACPALPGETNETADSKTYWANHAVVFNGQSLIASTLTKDCPY